MKRPSKADVDPELMLAMFLGQFIYGTGDGFVPAAPAGGYANYPASPYCLFSAMRSGSSLAQNMYGYNSSSNNPNTFPFNGVGKMGMGTIPILTNPSSPPIPVADIVNMTYCPADPFIFDPERSMAFPNARQSFLAMAAPYVGWNVPYTYPDKNNLFLGAMNSNGDILAPSWWRPWSTFGSMDPVVNLPN